MARILCVPNFSAGRDQETLEALVSVVRAVDGAHVLDASRDEDHNRAVVSFVAEGGAAFEAGLGLMRVALERIDMMRHVGVHPRIGATDVFPFVPLSGATLADCVTLARGFAESVAEELEIPVFLYGAAALRAGRELLPDVRRGGFEALCARAPLEADFGPARVHPTAGATAIGAREFLVAFNVNLDASDPGPARRIARAIRESSGGLPGVRALGLELPSLGITQVSVNLVDYRRTGIRRLFEEVETLAALEGVEILESELIGLAPAAALDEELAHRVRLFGFDPARSVVERRIEALEREVR